MKEKMKYQPEDIEALLAEKSFRELYAEEKKFVLEHLASPQEYEQMRETLLSIRGGAGGDRNELFPGDHVRERLMKEFEEKKRRGAIIWWNGLLIGMRDTLRFDLPAVRYGFVILLLALGSIFWFRHNGGDNKGIIELAQQNKVIAPGMEPQQNVAAVSVDSMKKDDELVTPITETSSKPVYPAPIQPGYKRYSIPKDQNVVAVKTTIADSVAVLLSRNDTGAIVKNTFDADGADSNSVAVSAITFGSASNAYAWQSNSNALTANNATLTSGTYTVTVTDATVCNGAATGTATISGGTAGYTYTWSNNNGNVSIPRSRSLGSDPNAIKLFFELK